MPSDFFEQNTLAIARGLLGCQLTHQTSDGLTAGIIVETEAYLGEHDPASHAFRGHSPRNAAMFGPPGHAYIYFTYGMHWCVNVSTRPAGVGEAVLIRALQPTDGIKLMQQRRKNTSINQLCNGPAKLVQALAITKDLYGHDLSQPPLWIATGQKPAKIIATKRVGIKQATDQPWRFYIANNPYVSKPWKKLT